MFWAAIITGLIGSVHCMGMCGPLICVMPIAKNNASAKISGLVLYNLGRVLSYALLGVAVAGMGAAVSLFAGAWFGYIGGTFLIALGLYTFIRKKRTELKMPSSVRKWMGKLLKVRSTYTLPVLGMLNGIIPCGAVYTALAGSAVLANPVDGALYMLLFGVATWPAVFSSYYLTNKLVLFLKGYYRSLTSVFLIVMGVVLFYRSSHEHMLTQTPNTMTVCQ